MESEMKAQQEGQKLFAQGEVPMRDELEMASAQFVHNIMDVLFPAKSPPEPVNARVIRRFDLEAAREGRRPAPLRPEHQAGTVKPAAAYPAKNATRACSKQPGSHSNSVHRTRRPARVGVDKKAGEEPAFSFAGGAAPYFTSLKWRIAEPSALSSSSYRGFPRR